MSYDGEPCQELSGNSKEHIIPRTASVERHPRALQMEREFNFDKKVADLSCKDEAYLHSLDLEGAHQQFFNNVPTVRHYTDFSFLKNNIRMYAIRRLIDQGKIKLYSFDSNASMTNLKINSKETSLVPRQGAFVLSLPGNVEIILFLDVYPSSVAWKYTGLSYEDFTTFEKLLEEDIKTDNLYFNKVFTQTGEFIELPQVTFNDIYLVQSLRKEIQTNIINFFDPKLRELKKKNGLPSKRGIIFAGEPGTGKTFLSRVLAGALDSTFMIVTKLYDASELTHYMDFMKQFPNAAILFEDIDIYVPDRNSGSPIVSALLNSLDGIAPNENILVLCTTNELKVLDRAIKDRPGRFDRTLKFNAPDAELKTIMLKGFCNNHDCTNIDFDAIIGKVPAAHTGAHLKEIYITAVTLALEANSYDANGMALLSTEIFINALMATQRPSDTKKMGFKREDRD